jgi:hypothetical protein
MAYEFDDVLHFCLPRLTEALVSAGVWIDTDDGYYCLRRISDRAEVAHEDAMRLLNEAWGNDLACAGINSGYDSPRQQLAKLIRPLLLKTGTIPLSLSGARRLAAAGGGKTLPRNATRADIVRATEADVLIDYPAHPRHPVAWPG